MKKLLALILAMLMLMATLAGCGEDKEKDKDEDSKPSVSQEKDDPKPEKEPEKKDESKDAIKVADKIMKAMFETGEGEAVINALPEVVLEAMEEEGTDVQAVVDIYDAALAETVAAIDSIEEVGFEVSWEAVNTTELDEDEIADIVATYEDEIGLELDIEAAMEVDYELTAKLEDEEDTTDFALNVIKVDGKWCIDLSSFAEAMGEM